MTDARSSQSASSRSLLLAVLVAVVACGAGTPALVVAPVDAPASSGQTSAASIDAGAPEGSGVCHRVLEVGPVVPTPSTCWIDQRVGEKSARLTYPCAGGVAMADFGTLFDGSVDSTGSLHLEATTTFHWSGDGCTWQSVQGIGGNLGAGELLYTYEEHPTEGEGCAPANCKAKVPVRIGAAH